MSDGDYEDDFGTRSQSKVSSKRSPSTSKSISRSASLSESSSSRSITEERKASGGILHQSKRTVVAEIPEDHTSYRKVDDPDSVEDLDASGSLSGSVSDHQKTSRKSSSAYSTSSSATPERKASSGSSPDRKGLVSAPAGRQRSRDEDRRPRADSVGNSSQKSQGDGTFLPPLGPRRYSRGIGGSKTSPQVSPARSDRSRGGVHSSAVTRTSLLDRIEDLKNEIKEIDTRIAKRQRELDRWKNVTNNTSQRRRRFVDKLLTENEFLEKKLETYDGQVVNVAFLIARTEEQLRRAEARLVEVTKIKRALSARDKRAAHTIEVVHRYMPSAEELETREVNETIYSCASLEKKVAYARDTLQRTEESLELMNKSCERLQREVDRRNIASVSVKTYEELRAKHEEQAKEIQRLRESISIYINAVNAERARVSTEVGGTPRDGGDAVPTYVRELQHKREALQEQVEEVKAAIEKRAQKIETNRKYMDQFRKKRADGGDENQLLSFPTSSPTSPNRSGSRQISGGNSRKRKGAPDPLEEALLGADQATKRIQQEMYQPASTSKSGLKISFAPLHSSNSPSSNRGDPKEDSMERYEYTESKAPSPGEKAAMALAGSKRDSSPPPDFAETHSGRNEDEEGFMEEELPEDEDDAEVSPIAATPASPAGKVGQNEDDDDDLGDSSGNSTPSWLN